MSGHEAGQTSSDAYYPILIWHNTLLGFHLFTATGVTLPDRRIIFGRTRNGAARIPMRVNRHTKLKGVTNRLEDA